MTDDRLGDLTAIEQEAVAASRSGEWFEAEGLDLLRLTHTHDPRYQIRAEVVRDLLLGRHGPLDPRGVRLAGVQITGPLDLEDVDAEVGLKLVDCALPEVMNLTGAHLPRLTLDGSRLVGIAAHGVEIDKDCSLDGVVVRCSAPEPALTMVTARIGGMLLIRDAVIVNASGPAFTGEAMSVGEILSMAGSTLRGTGSTASIYLVKAHIGYANFDELTVANDRGPALQCSNLRSDSHVWLRRAKVRGTGSVALSLTDAHIGGSLSLDLSQVQNHDGAAVTLNDTTVQNHVLVRAAHLRGGGSRVALDLSGARVDGLANLDRVDVANYQGGSALGAEGASVGKYLFVRDARLLGTSPAGAVRFPRARIGSSVEFNGTTITNGVGPGLHAESADIGHSLFFRDATVHASHSRGSVWVFGVHIGGTADFSRTTVTNMAGPALEAERMRTDGHLVFSGTEFRGRGTRATVQLPGAHVRGNVHCPTMRVESESGQILDLVDAVVDGAITIPTELICPEPRGTSCVRAKSVNVDGMTCGSLGSPWREWLHVIRRHGFAYRPQPYQHLAAIERAAGHDNNAREVLIAQQHHLSRDSAGVGGLLARAIHLLWGVLAGYGFRARRTAIALFLAVAVAGCLGWLAGQVETRPGHHAAERVRPATVQPDAPGTPCSTVELVGLGLDRGLPLGVTGLRARCDLDTASTPGQRFTIAIWIVQFCIFGLATLAIAGYTNLIRKTP
ncbi:hypothetical protein LZG04_21190 [Saccharothrix sp. S26]|uniref:hypothetical protein n=1 Tax=Saccharothrix sp. S26 TaxID=2907215 RepID=UPI001F44D68A|nr:hypothetical protein [Saccharothrix sp. S26]MCE6997299.1 hypothetical protein [Saccharothrix sp. S26]